MMKKTDSITEYEQRGYLDSDFKYFHISDKVTSDIDFHYHDFYKIILILKGNVRYLIEGREYELLPFDFVLVNRFDIHKPVVDSNDDYDRIILYLKPEFLEKLGLLDAFVKAKELESYVVRFNSGTSAHIYDMLLKAQEDIRIKDTEYAGELTAKIDIIQTLIEFNKACISEDFGFRPEARFNRKVIEIIEYINENLQKDLSIDSIADKFYLSKYHMMRIFKSETGYSVHRYISEKRILLARNLIMSGIPSTTACLECGFKDYSSFSRAFKNQLGILPSEVKI
ncbi:MAG: helix-turn-helix domain-containing protein [Butyrivibrio sp.]|nr:helix-turn-helix domain-containing protein [Butyrivibrio sp.]